MTRRSNIQRCGEIDSVVVQEIAKALAGTGKPFVITSGVAILKPGRVGVETDNPDPSSAGAHRIQSELAGFAAADQGVRASIVRPGASVHGDGDHGFIPILINVARLKAKSVYIGDGMNRWPAIHRLDAARLFRLALEKGVAGGRYHAVENEGTPYIYGVYDGKPAYPDFDGVLASAMNRALREAASARNPLDYQFVIRHFLASFSDPHVNVSFNTLPSSYQWPGFIVIYRGHKYQIAASEVSAVQNGEVLEECDGNSADQLLQHAASIRHGLAHDESEKAYDALRMLAFPADHYEAMPKSCRIGGREVALEWRRIAENSFTQNLLPYRKRPEFPLWRGSTLGLKISSWSIQRI